MAAPKGNKYSPGAPLLYKPEYDDQARKYCLLGATDAELADFFDVDESTINNWKIKFPSFFESIKDGRERADANVADSLYKRATGYSHNAVKIFCDAKTGEVTEAPYVEHYPPDPASMAIWLKNRRMKNWREKPQEQTPSQTPQDIDTLKNEIRKLVDENGFHN